MLAPIAGQRLDRKRAVVESTTYNSIAAAPAAVVGSVSISA
jgi:hypothetical protein